MAASPSFIANSPSRPLPSPAPVELAAPRGGIISKNAALMVRLGLAYRLRLRAPIPRTLQYAERLSAMGRGQQRRDNRPDIVGHPNAPQSCLRRDESIHFGYVAQ
jgi:hypothetical protein